MKKEELIAKGLTEDQAKAVMEIYTEEMKGYIPKSRFDEVNTANTELEEANKQTKKDYEARIRDMKLTSAIKDQLTDCKYPDLVADKFDRSKLILAEDGSVSGLTEQLKTVKETYKELFTPPVSGKTPPNNGKTPPQSTAGGDRRAELEKLINDPKTRLADRIAARNELFSLEQAGSEE